MSEIKQVSLFVENRPGRTAKVAKTLSDAGVNIRALTIAEAGDFAAPLDVTAGAAEGTGHGFLLKEQDQQKCAAVLRPGLREDKRADQRMVLPQTYPPSTGRSAPVTKAAASLIR